MASGVNETSSKKMLPNLEQEQRVDPAPSRAAAKICEA
jgi:hypothetical protein